MDLTLRRKYRLFQDTIRSNASTSSYYGDYSLPNVTIKHSLVIEDSEVETQSGETKQKSDNPRKYRRTLSDGSKYKKTGVHVKGKRRAPPPPTFNNNLMVRSTSETPSSTFLRNKKKRAPPPPLILKSEPDLPTINNIHSDGIEPIFKEGFLEDKEIQAILEMPKALTEEQKRIVIENVVKVHEAVEENENQCLSNDTLKLEKGMLRSTKPVTPTPSLPSSPTRKDECPSTPLSPISPRPWYKRPISGSREHTSIPFKKEIILRTVDKRRSKKQENENLPEIGYSRNSLFESAAKLGFFRSKSTLTEDSVRKRNEDKEKRKSGIGIPSISELDREAAEIVLKEQASVKARQQEADEKYYTATPPEPTSPKAKELISKFEESSSQQKITINTSFIGKNDYFEDSKIKTEDDSNDTKSSRSSESPIKTETKPKSEILGQWVCPYCTLENPNWRIICEVCEKIKPYDLRFVESSVQHQLPATKAPPSLTNSNYDPLSPFKSPLKTPSKGEWNQKAEKLRKYFNSTNKNQNTISKSASETSINKTSFIYKPDNPKFGSPKLPMRNYLIRDKPDIIKIQTSLDESKFDRLETLEESKEENVRSHLNPESRIEENRKSSSPSNIKREITTEDELEKEKERIREMIRQMNARALAEKYPVIKSPQPTNKVDKEPESVSSSTPAIVGGIRKMAPPPNDQNKLGAIKKLFARKDKSKEDSPTSDTKSETNETVIKNNKIYENFPIYENIKDDVKNDDKLVIVETSLCNGNETSPNNSDKYLQNDFAKVRSRDDVSKSGSRDIELTVQQNEQIQEITEQLKSRKGVDDFKATLRTSPKKMNNTDTLAINKILRNLEDAISDGEYEMAATLAKKLARMKVSLSVTKQKDRPISGVDFDNNDIV